MDIRVCSVTEAADRDRSAHTAEGSAPHITQGIEELLEDKGALKPVLSLIGLWKAHSSLSSGEIL